MTKLSNGFLQLQHKTGQFLIKSTLCQQQQKKLKTSYTRFYFMILKTPTFLKDLIYF